MEASGTFVAQKRPTSEAERLPPQDLEAEQSLLGSMLISAEAIGQITEMIKPDDFYRDAHRAIFEAVLRLYAMGEPADPITVCDELNQMGSLEAAGGKPYVHTLISAVPTAANAKYYARIVERNAVLRSMIRAATAIAGLGYEAPEDVEQALDRAEALIFNVSQRRIAERFLPLRELLTEAFERIEHLYEAKASITGIPTGFEDLDTMTSGLHPSDLVIVAARPSMGKTSLALNVAQRVGLSGHPVAIFSLEMSRQQLAQRLLCAEARVNSQALRTGSLADEDWPRLSSAVGKLADAPIYIDDTAGITVMELRAKARRLSAQHKLGLIIIDYLQLMQGGSRSENRQQEISEISRALKVLARELDVPIIAISQLSRAVEARNEKRPMLSDLRESGAIEQDADLVLFIYRDEYYNRDTDDKGIAELIVGKHRNGPTGVVRLAFLEDYTKFANLAKSAPTG